MYIAIEGTKGTGKSTLIRALKQKFAQEGIDFQCFSPTQPMPKETWWEQAYSNFYQDDVYLDSLYTARANYHASQIHFDRPFILGDRSILTSFVTRWPHHNPADLVEYIRHVRQKEFLVPLPDFVLYLDLPIDVTLTRLAQRQRDYGLHDENESRLWQAKQAYLTLFQQKNQLGLSKLEYQWVDANQSAQNLLENVYALVVQQLEKCEPVQ